jgi:hypothetical protein
MLKAHPKISLALLCCAICVSCQPAFDPNKSIFDPTELAPPPDWAETLLVRRIANLGRLPDRFEVRMVTPQLVELSPWPRNGTYAQARVDINRGDIGDIDFVGLWPTTQPTTRPSGGT